MKSLVRAMLVVLVCGLMPLASMAEEKVEGEKKAKPEGSHKDMAVKEKPVKAPEVTTDATLTGTIVSVDTKRGEKTVPLYYLETADGKIPLRSHYVSGTGETKSKLDVSGHVGKQVTLQAKVVMAKAKGSDKEKVRKIVQVTALTDAQ